MKDEEYISDDSLKTFLKRLESERKPEMPQFKQQISIRTYFKSSSKFEKTKKRAVIEESKSQRFEKTRAQPREEPRG